MIKIKSMNELAQLSDEDLDKLEQHLWKFWQKVREVERYRKLVKEENDTD